MKIDRLIGIITILLQKQKVTAPYLAKKFEVSRRTINRDIEVICQAGIPIVTTQGTGGGISIADGYKIDKNVLTSDEFQTLLAGLKSLESISGTAYSEKLQDKLFAGNENSLSFQDTFLIDLSSYHRDSLTKKIQLLQAAINGKRLISFDYYYNKGESRRVLEPYRIVFRWAAWYVFGYCTKRRDFRMFKLSRLWDLRLTDEPYIERFIPNEKLDFEGHFTDEIKFEGLFDASEKYRLIDEYGKSCFTYAEDGRLRFQFSFTNKDTLVRWLLGFGDKVEVLAPEEMRLAVLEKAKNILKRYNAT